VVFLQHGLFSSAACWIGNFADKTPAFMFASAGYDVWLGNNRGNKFSRAHTTHNLFMNSKKFFTYSFQELGEFDLPAQIDSVLSVTGV
jgi:lysosomal acid lipase/cholesteryl ester hydrolase